MSRLGKNIARIVENCRFSFNETCAPEILGEFRETTILSLSQISQALKESV